MTWVEGADLVVGSVLGLRTFILDEGFHLKSPSYSFTWFPGWNDAKCDCTYFSGGAPRKEDGEEWGAYSERIKATKSEWHKPETASCGFHAYLRSQEVDAMERGAYGDRPLWGVLEAAGSVVIGKQGFRAQSGRIVALALEPLDNGGWELSQKAKDRIAEAYPAVHLFPTREAMLKEYTIAFSGDFALKDKEVPSS